MIRLLFILLLACAGWYYYPQFTTTHWPAGMLVRTAPYQAALTSGKLHQKGDYSIQELAIFQLNARVLSKARYSEDLSPYDLALGWQEMSDSAVLDRLDISQFGRYYQYRWQNPPPTEPGVIARSSANTHMIPANDAVLGTLRKLREGDLVQIKGFLVHVNGPNGWSWQSSMTRDDQGPGACELVWVESITLLDKPPA